MPGVHCVRIIQGCIQGGGAKGALTAPASPPRTLRAIFSTLRAPEKAYSEGKIGKIGLIKMLDKKISEG